MTIYGEVLDMVLGAIVKAHGVGQTALCCRHLRHLAVVLIVPSVLAHAVVVPWPHGQSVPFHHPLSPSLSHFRSLRARTLLALVDRSGRAAALIDLGYVGVSCDVIDRRTMYRRR
jgi:hypothetical protein